MRPVGRIPLTTLWGTLRGASGFSACPAVSLISKNSRSEVRTLPELPPPVTRLEANSASGKGWPAMTAGDSCSGRRWSRRFAAVKHRWSRTVALFLALACSCQRCAQRNAPKVGTDSRSEAAIRGEALAFYRDLAARDTPALLNHFWPAKIAARWEPPFESPVPGPAVAAAA